MADITDSIYYQNKLQAIEGILLETEEYFYRKITRWYSSTYSTPLHQVRKLPYPVVLREYYEAMLEQLPYNDIIDMAKEELLPDFIEERDSDLEDFIKAVEEEERLKQQKREEEEAISKKKESINNEKIQEVDLKFDEE